MSEEMNRWVVVVAELNQSPDIHMISVDSKHSGDEVAQGFAYMNREHITKESKVFVFAAEEFLEMLREKGDTESLSLAAKVEETFKIEPKLISPYGVTVETPDMKQVHDDQGIPESGQETG